MDRDLNAAINIRAVGQSVLTSAMAQAIADNACGEMALVTR